LAFDPEVTAVTLEGIVHKDTRSQDHASRFVYFTSDFEGKRAVYRTPL